MWILTTMVLIGSAVTSKHERDSCLSQSNKNKYTDWIRSSVFYKNYKTWYWKELDYYLDN